MRARPDVQAQLDGLIQQQRAGLRTPLAQQQFDVDSRRLRAQWAEKIGAHADEQQKAWATDTNMTSYTLAGNQLARNAADPANFAQSRDQMRKALVRNAQLAGQDPAGAVLKANQAAAVLGIHALLPTDPAAAKKMLDENAQYLGALPDYDQIVRSVRDGLVNSEFAPTLDKQVSDTLASAQAQVSTVPGPLVPGGKPSARIAAPKGGVFDTIASTAQAHGFSSAETAYAQRAAQIESSGNPNAPGGGLFQLRGDLAERAGLDPARQTVEVLNDARANGRILYDAGIQRPTAADLYIMHQQGPAGGKALLTAPPEVNAVSVLTPIYQHAHPDWSPAQAANVATAAVTRNGGSASMSAGDFVTYWTSRYNHGGSGAPGGGTGLSVADTLRTQMPQLLDQARKTAEEKWPLYPDVQDRFVQAYQRRVEQQISQQDQQYEVNTHVVQQAMVAGRPISEQELTASSPEVAQAWTRMQIENPLAAAGVERMFDANARGAAAQFGTEFKNDLDRVLAPDGDPTRVKDPSGLWSKVGSGPDATLTNSGVAALSILTKMRGAPSGEAAAAQIKQFVDQLHGELTYSNPGVGRYDVKGEAGYAKFMAVALPQIEAAYKSGKLSAALDPKSPDYLGKAALPFMRTRAQMMKDAVTDPQFSTGQLTVQSLAQLRASLDNDAQWQETLRAAVANHTLTRPVYEAYLASQQPRRAPAEKFEAPAPQPAPAGGAIYPLPPGYSAPR